MEAFKLDRVENLEWKAPILTFEIERHGATVMGSGRGDIQAWSIDFENRAAQHRITGRRQLRPMAKGLKVEPIVEQVCDKIKNGVTAGHSEGIQWQSEDKVKVKPASFIPNDGPNQTIAGRRKRFRAAISVAMTGMGWKVLDNSSTWITFIR